MCVTVLIAQTEELAANATYLDPTIIKDLGIQHANIDL